MEITKTYDPSAIEGKRYQQWLDKGFFQSQPDDDREPYTIVIPPPNVTGVLHLGHTLNNTIQDALIRKARMQGYNACWVPGTDHASIATEAKVVEMLREKGINKNNLTREEFLEYAWEWKEEYGGIILNQLRRLGASCDWSRTSFTMDDHYYKAVIKTFNRLYEDGYIYRGTKIINWDPSAKTALSNEEVFYKEEESELYHVQYQIKGEDKTIEIATTRPETILADTGICVNPEDERFKDFIGKTALVPLVEREVPIFADEYVDPEFGTGALKVTPAHDPNDFDLGQKHSLEIINILNEDATINENAQFYIGQNRFDARESILNDLEKSGQLVKRNTIQNNVGYSQRTDSVIEPRISTQWFCSMKKLAEPAIENVLNGNIRFFPDKFINTYKHWMENIRDWCISRQLWWGHRIPAYYFGSDDEDFVVAESAEEALQKARKISGNEKLTTDDLKQDEDVLDTWFSSWLWPMEVFKGVTEPGNAEFKYYYPTSTLVTGPDILFFWIARMIVAGYYFEDKKPFRDVYLTGMVRDKNRKKMSKSLGNSPDLFKLLDEYGADGVRFSILVSSPAGNDLLFDEKKCEQGRNFCNKLWNALRLVKSWENNGLVDHDDDSDDVATAWLENKFRFILKKAEGNYDDYRLSDALMELYRFAWNDFCSGYLEMIKPAKGAKISGVVWNKTIQLFEDILRALHPFQPFITEEAWHHLREREENDFLIVADYPVSSEYDEKILEEGEIVQELISKLRNMLADNELEPSETKVLFKSDSWQIPDQYIDHICKLSGISSFEITQQEPANSLVVVLKAGEVFIPFSDSEALNKQISKLEKEIEYTQGFLKSVNKKLDNPRFVDNAKPEIVEKERQKKEDAEEKVRRLEENLQRITQN